MHAAKFVYITCGNRDEALTIGSALVTERLAACVNILEPMTSVYRWNNAIEQATEAVLLAKTRPELIGPLTDRVKELHSYDCPCIVHWSVEPGNDAYIAWISDETRPQAG